MYRTVEWAGSVKAKSDSCAVRDSCGFFAKCLGRFLWRIDPFGLDLLSSLSLTITQPVPKRSQPQLIGQMSHLKKKTINKQDGNLEELELCEVGGSSRVGSTAPASVALDCIVGPRLRGQPRVIGSDGRVLAIDDAVDNPFVAAQAGHVAEDIVARIQPDFLAGHGSHIGGDIP